MSNVLTIIRKNENNPALSGMVKSFDAKCGNCKPISPLQCIDGCRVYKLKNELRCLGGAMGNPGYTKNLFNALKNETRIQILQAIVNGRCSVTQLQKELSRTEHSHSQVAIREDYLEPLMAVGLASEARDARDEYYASSFGTRLTNLLGDFPELAKKLPTNSGCYEETLLQSLLAGPKTFEEVEALTAPNIVSRILKRLRSIGLVETTRDRDYIFFFKSKRDPNKETFTEVEKKIYDAIVQEGISAGKLARETGLSKRLTYEYLRRLRGKKLVFVRRTPKVYGLTGKGKKLAWVLQNIQQLVEDTCYFSQQVMQDTGGGLIKMGSLPENAYLR